MRTWVLPRSWQWPEHVGTEPGLGVRRERVSRWEAHSACCLEPGRGTWSRGRAGRRRASPPPRDGCEGRVMIPPVDLQDPVRTPPPQRSLSRSLLERSRELYQAIFCFPPNTFMDLQSFDFSASFRSRLPATRGQSSRPPPTTVSSAATSGPGALPLVNEYFSNGE